MDFARAVTDLKNRTFSRLPGDFSRLVYLASSRDYNNGRYYHEGLAFHFGEEAASKALAACHREVFDRLVFDSLEELIGGLSNYIFSTGELPEEFLKSWRHLESYRMLIPSQCDQLAAKFLLSSVQVALAILEARQKAPSQNLRFSQPTRPLH